MGNDTSSRGNRRRAPWLVALAVAATACASLGYFLPLLAARHPAWRHPIAWAMSSGSLLAVCIGASGMLAAVWSLRRLRASRPPPRLDMLRGLSRAQLESMLCEAFRRQGYHVERRGRNGFGQLVLVKPARRIVVHWKRGDHAQIDSGALRELCAGMADEQATGGLFITNGQFTVEAMRFARDVPVGLVSGPALLELLKVPMTPEPVAPLKVAAAAEPVAPLTSHSL